MPMETNDIHIFWFRRDLRLHDNTGLYAALDAGKPVLPVFIFDKHILDKLEDKDDARVTFIHDEIDRLKSILQGWGSDLLVFHGTPEEIYTQLMTTYPVCGVFTNMDYEPYARQRDKTIAGLCEQNGIVFHVYKDHVIFDKNEVVKDDGKPYTVFTPYKRKWLDRFHRHPPVVRSKTEKELAAGFFKTSTIQPMPSLESMGFVRSSHVIPSREVPRGMIAAYDKTRDFPAMDATSKLGIHFRFGTLSIREKALAAATLNETYLSELIWRDFYSMILWHFPHVAKGAFKPEYDRIEWANDTTLFDAWCQGKTGYPLVDAGMRQLAATGYMHNRVRMVVASFLTKHLLIDWRWGEAWFARHLLDFDLASNNGGWQWAAGSGTDAAPYFRIFNPAAQLEKFDKNLAYVKKWVPEYGTSAYVKPIVDHKIARETCLTTYARALKPE